MFTGGLVQPDGKLTRNMCLADDAQESWLVVPTPIISSLETERLAYLVHLFFLALRFIAALKRVKLSHPG